MIHYLPKGTSLEMPDKNSTKLMTSKTKLKSFGSSLSYKKVRYSIIIKLETDLTFPYFLLKSHVVRNTDY